MASESEKRETLADIVAQMRGRGEDGRMDRRLWLDYADRIEAAAKRVVVSKTETTTVGNAAAMCEALVKIRRELNTYCNDCTLLDRVTEDPPDYTCLRDSLLEIECIVDAALAEPARQCDVGTAEEQRERFERFCLHEFCNKKCPCYGRGDRCELLWAQTPYKAREIVRMANHFADCKQERSDPCHEK